MRVIIKKLLREGLEKIDNVKLVSKSGKGNRYFKMLKTAKFQHYDMPKGELVSFSKGEEDRKGLVSKLSKQDKKTYRAWIKTPEGEKSMKIWDGISKAWKKRFPDSKHNVNESKKVKIILESKKKGDIHLALDNGGRPFITKVEDKYLNVYKDELRYDYKKVFDGIDTKGDKDSTILVHLEGNKYLFVGSTVYEFETDNDKIVKYDSPIGNSAVPYPVAFGEKYVYFMKEQLYVDKGEFEDIKSEYENGKYKNSYGINDDGWCINYGIFYEYHNEVKKDIKTYKMKKYKEIIKRQ